MTRRVSFSVFIAYTVSLPKPLYRVALPCMYFGTKSIPLIVDICMSPVRRLPSTGRREKPEQAEAELRQALNNLSSNGLQTARLLHSSHPWRPGLPSTLSGPLVCCNNFCVHETFEFTRNIVPVRPQTVAAVPRVLAAYVPCNTTLSNVLTSRNGDGIVGNA